MPGYELIDKSEFKEISEIFKKSKILCRMGFDKSRNGVYKVRVFENLFAKFVFPKTVVYFLYLLILSVSLMFKDTAPAYSGEKFSLKGNKIEIFNLKTLF